MAPHPNLSSGSISSGNGSQISLQSFFVSKSSKTRLPSDSSTRSLLNIHEMHQNPNVSVDSIELFGSGGLPKSNVNRYPQTHVDQSFQSLTGNGTCSSEPVYDQPGHFQNRSRSSMSSAYQSFKELIYASIRKTQGPKLEPPFDLKVIFSFSICLVAISLSFLVLIQFSISKKVYVSEGCFLCSNLKNISNVGLFRRHHDFGVNYCCIKSFKDPIPLMQKAIRKTKRSHSKTTDWKDMRLSNNTEEINQTQALLYTLNIGGISVHFDPSRHNKVLPLRTLNGSGDGLELKNDHVIITKPGRYFIESQYSTKIMGQLSIKDLKNVLGHALCRKNRSLPGGKQTMAVGFHTSTTATDLHTSHIGGVFHLKENDKIYVGISQAAQTKNQNNQLILLRLGSSA